MDTLGAFQSITGGGRGMEKGDGISNHRAVYFTTQPPKSGIHADSGAFWSSFETLFKEQW